MPVSYTHLDVYKRQPQSTAHLRQAVSINLAASFRREPEVAAPDVYKRQHMGRSRNRRGFGWKRWSRRWLYEELKLFNGYRVRRATAPKALPA